VSKDGVGGFHQHTAAIGKLLTSLYEAGAVAARHGPDDPSPGVESIRGVMEQLDTTGLTHVISLDQTQGVVLCQSRCSLVTLARVIQEHGLWPDLPPSLLATTVGGAVLQGLIPAERIVWVEVLTVQGAITRHQPGQLPPDSLVLAVCLNLHTTNPVTTNQAGTTG